MPPLLELAYFVLRMVPAAVAEAPWRSWNVNEMPGGSAPLSNVFISVRGSTGRGAEKGSRIWSGFPVSEAATGKSHISSDRESLCDDKWREVRTT